LHYKVSILPVALADAAEYVAFIREEKLEPLAARRWYDGLVETIVSLEHMPSAHPVIPEQEGFTISIRQVHYHSHRVIFHIDEASRTVFVLRVYHGARDVLRPDQVDLP
jgi:plasmid stabilization system protein ParE